MSQTFIESTRSSITSVFLNKSGTRDRPEQQVLSSNQALKLISESPSSKIVIADSSNYHNILRQDCSQKFVLKTLNNETPEAGEIKRFYNEYGILKNVSHPGIRQAYAKGKFEGKHTLFLEWVHGKTIKEIGKMDVQEFLIIAQKIVEAFVELHAHGIVHKDVSADNILVNPDTRQMKIIDFNLSSKNGVKEHLLYRSCRRKRNSFISPEQGGMANHVIDHRTDLYSLGYVFYYMLAGKHPFKSNDQLKLLEMHAFSHPPHLCTIGQTIPVPLSDLVAKLMKKKPDDRYQSAIGLLYDFRLISSQIQLGRLAFDFSPAKKDNLDRLHFPEKLYGRTKQIEALLSAFDCVGKGALQMFLISGPSGTGKSSLVENLREPVVRKNGYFIRGKYDQLQKSEPYSAILQAFNNLCELVLKESDETRDRFQKIVQEAVGAEGKILTDVVPDMELIIGSQPQVPEVGALETQTRFNYILRKFVKAISTANHPILLFIDDLQWADSASLALLSVLIADKEIKYLLFVGAYRENEVTESHPLAINLLNDKKNAVNMQRMKVGSLSRKNIDELISDLLDTPKEDIYELTNSVHEKTDGNPFFVVEFLKTLLDEKILYLSHHEFRWKWNAKKIKEKDVTKNVINVITSQILKLSKETRNALKIASCLGRRFDLSILNLIMGEDDAGEILEEALLKYIIKRSSTESAKFYFSHDRVQQAVYTMIRESERNTIHLYIGRILQEKLSQKKLDEMLFLVVNQLNTGLNSITDKHKKTCLARLNQEAGEKARLSSAFELAAGFLSIGIGLLHSNSWKEDYDLSFKLHVTASEMAYFNGNFDNMNEILGQAFANVTSILDKAKLYAIKIKALRAQNKIDETLETGLHVLEQLRESIPAQSSMLSLTWELSKARLLLWNKDNDLIASMSAMKDERAIAAMTIMADILPSARMTNPQLLALITFRMNQLTIKYGITKHSMFGFACYGMINAVFFCDYKEGHRIGQLLVKLLERFPEKQYHCWTKVFVYSVMSLHKGSMRLSLKPLEDAIWLGQESGDIEYSFLGIARYCAHAFLVGNKLLEVEEKMRSYCQQIKAHKQQHVLDMVAPFWQAILNLLGSGSDDPTKLRGEAFDEEVMCQSNFSKNVFANSAVHFNSMILAYFFDRYDVAAQSAKECERVMKKLLHYEKQNLHLYSGLITLALAKQVKDKSHLMKKAEEKVGKMRVLASFCSDTYLNKLHLLEAETAALKGNQKEAIEHFQNAIDLAKSQNFIHEEALACERAGIFYAETNQEQLAFEFLSRACKVYQVWGAEAKVCQLQKLYEKLFQRFQDTEIRAEL